ncbi:unnamed protein product [Vicia faba]|uniref:Uncharacterized protein n=1 Tax=Vicia faba TaxID=3906 RepID=A0AAV1AR93_VICFA|nr:unnamed protein product [Vicia faba]
MASVGVAPTLGFRETSSHGEIGVEVLPEEMNNMKIMDDKKMEATVVDSGNGTKTGHIIVTTISGRNDNKLYGRVAISKVESHLAEARVLYDLLFSSSLDPMFDAG